MRSFDEIHDIACKRHGGQAALADRLGPRADPAAAITLSDDRWLSVLTRCIFNAGFNWKVIEAKWDGFEEAFDGFDPGRCAFMDDDRLDALLRDTRIVRNGAKIVSVRDNASFILSLGDRGGAGSVLGGWPSTDFVGLLGFLKSNGARLGGATAQYAMRFAGRDGFILSQDVTARLIAEGVIDKPAGSKSSMTAVQSAFNTWMEQSGRPLTEISRVLAMSV